MFSGTKGGAFFETFDLQTRAYWRGELQSLNGIFVCVWGGKEGGPWFNMNNNGLKRKLI